MANERYRRVRASAAFWRHEGGLEAVEWTAAMLVAITLLVGVAYALRTSGGDTAAALTGTFGRLITGLASGTSGTASPATPHIQLVSAGAPALGLPGTLLAAHVAPTRMLLGAALLLSAAALLAAPGLSPVQIAGSLVGSLGAALLNLRVGLTQALQRAMSQAAPSFWRALQHSRSTPIRVSSLRGQLAEVRYFRLSNRISTLLRTGYWIEDADVVHLRITGVAGQGGRAPLIDFVLRPLHSRNPITLLGRLLRGQSIWVPYTDPRVRIVSAKTGTSAFLQLRLFFANRLSPAMQPAWRRFLQGKPRVAVTNTETLAQIRHALVRGNPASSRQLTRIANQLFGGNRVAATRFLQDMLDNTTAVGRSAVLERLVASPTGLRGRLNPRSLATSGGWARAGALGGIIAGGISSWINIQDVRAGKISPAQATGNIVADTVGGVGAGLAGMYVGGVIGSFIPIPVVGTVVGMLVGFVVGIAVGWIYDTFIRNYVAAAVTKLVEFGAWAVNKVRDLGHAILNGGRAAVNLVRGGLNRLGQGFKTIISWF